MRHALPLLLVLLPLPAIAQGDPAPEAFPGIEQPPELIGGLEALQGHLSYPESARRMGAEGTVFLQFVVDKDGSVRDVDVMRGIHPALDSTAVAALHRIEFRAGTMQGKPAPMRYALPVRFRLPDPRPGEAVGIRPAIGAGVEPVTFEAAEQPPPPPPPELAPPPDTTEVYEIVEEPPELIGGLEALMQNLRYPKLAQDAGIEGRVYVQFVVDQIGAVRDAEVRRSPSPLLDAAALEVVREAEFRPGRHRGEPVKVRLMLPVQFRLR